MRQLSELSEKINIFGNNQFYTQKTELARTSIPLENDMIKSE